MKQSKEKFYKSHKLRTHLLALLCFLSIFIPVTFIVFNQYNFDNECGQNFVSVGPSAIGGDFTLTNTQNQKQKLVYLTNMSLKISKMNTGFITNLGYFSLLTRT